MAFLHRTASDSRQADHVNEWKTRLFYMSGPSPLNKTHSSWPAMPICNQWNQTSGLGLYAQLNSKITCPMQNDLTAWVYKAWIVFSWDMNYVQDPEIYYLYKTYWCIWLWVPARKYVKEKYCIFIKLIYFILLILYVIINIKLCILYTYN